MMNKEEVINEIKGMTVETFFSNSLFVSQPKVIKLIEQIKEPYKPLIPGYIADWIDKAKSEGDLTVVGAVNEAPEGEVSDWLILENVNTFAKAWVNGYEVKEEKKYIVKLKKAREINRYLNIGRNNDFLFSSLRETEDYKTRLTRREIESNGFGWVFDCEGIEIEEVE